MIGMDAIMTHTLDSTATPAAPAALPFISVVVPVRNEEAFLGGTLRQLAGQDYPADRFEVLVADGGSTDRTREVVQSFAADHPNVRLLDNHGGWSSAGRNAGVRASRGDLVVVIDGHCELDNAHHLAELARAFADSGAAAVGRPQPLDVRGASRLQRAISAARASRLGHHPDSHIYSDRPGFVAPQSVAVAYRREVFDEVGYFDEAFDACEDVEFNHRLARAGLRCWFTPRVVVRYHPRDSLAGLFRQMKRYGRGRVRLLRKHPETLTVPGFVPGVFVAGLFAGPVLAACSAMLGLLWLGGVATYLLVVLAFSTALAWRQRELALLPLLPAVFVTIHMGAGAGQWLELLSGRRPAATPEPVGAILSIPATVRKGVRRRPAAAPRVLNALTIDVEDYYHVSAFERCVRRDGWDAFEPRVEMTTRRLLDVLAAEGVRATFFVLGWVAQRCPGLVRAIRDAGHEVGCHSYSHRLVYDQTPREFRDDLRRALDMLQDALGEPIRAYRAPSFSITDRSVWALDILAEEGIHIDSSIYPTHHDRYGMPGAPLGPHPLELQAGTIWEFPPPVWQVCGYPLPVGGGGYFRLYPYALTRRGLREINRSGRPFAAYLHPWEIDPGQPRLWPGRLAAFRHYVGLRRTEERLRRLVHDFAFDTLSAALDHRRGSAPALRGAA
jgi:polysaccharide deacetylase family protein (PEP-CTERM system associated)